MLLFKIVSKYVTDMWRYYIRIVSGMSAVSSSTRADPQAS
jgi:hypothetical protein